MIELFAGTGGMLDEILSGAGVTGLLLAGGYALRSVAWSIREAGPEVRRWRKERRKALSR